MKLAPSGTRIPLTHGGLEGVEAGRGEQVGELDELHPEAGVGLVGPEALLGVEPREARDVGHGLAGDGLHRRRHGHGDEGQHLLLGDEAGLGVELHELELPIGAEVLVAEAAGDLVVAVDAADHAELLEQLRALGQRVELPRRLSARHHEVAGALGGGRDEHGRLDLDEALVVHGPSQRPVHLGPHPQVALHALGAQVHVAVGEADHLVDLDAVVELERRRLGGVEQLDLALPHLDLAGGQGRVPGALGACPHDADHPHHVLRAQLRGAVDHALHEAGVVAQVEEREVLTVLTTPRHPAAQRHTSTDVGGAQRPAVVGAHGEGGFGGHGSGPSGRGGFGAQGASRARRPSESIASGHGLLGAVAGHLADGDRTGGLLVGADDDHEPGTGAVGGLHLGLHRATVEGPLRRETGPAQLGAQVPGGVAAGGVDHEHRDLGLGRAEGPFGVAGQQDPLDAAAEADARGVGPAEGLGQPVVATSPTDGRLRGVERPADELEGGVGVVVEPADEAGLDAKGHVAGGEAGLDAVEAGEGGVAEAVGDAGSVGGGGDGRGTFRVEDPQRVGLDLLGVGGVEVADDAHEVAADVVDVAAAVVGGAHGVDDQLHLAQAEASVEVGQQDDDLDVEVGVGAPDRLDPELVVLAEPAGLRALVAEARRGVPDLPRHGGTVLDEGPHHRRRALRAQGQVAIALVEEVVHLLADHVGALAHAGEHGELLEHRALHQPVAGAPTWVAKAAISDCHRADSGGRTSLVPTGALKGSVRRDGWFGHGGRGYRPPPPPTIPPATPARCDASGPEGWCMLGP